MSIPVLIPCFVMLLLDNNRRNITIFQSYDSNSLKYRLRRIT